MARYGKKSSVPGTRVTRVTGYTGISLSNSTTIFTTTTGKRPILLLKESKGY